MKHFADELNASQGLPLIHRNGFRAVVTRGQDVQNTAVLHKVMQGMQRDQRPAQRGHLGMALPQKGDLGIPCPTAFTMYNHEGALPGPHKLHAEVYRKPPASL